MISEIVMDFFGWETVWRPSACGPETPAAPYRLRRSVELGACLVGTMTGPDGDLLCVRPCPSREDAEKWLSPPGRTIIDAVARALWKRLVGPQETWEEFSSRGEHLTGEASTSRRKQRSQGGKTSKRSGSSDIHRSRQRSEG
jgi:hypothetical protein